MKKPHFVFEKTNRKCTSKDCNGDIEQQFSQKHKGKIVSDGFFCSKCNVAYGGKKFIKTEPTDQTVFEFSLYKAKLKIKILPEHLPPRTEYRVIPNAKERKLRVGFTTINVTPTKSVPVELTVPDELKKLSVGSTVYVHIPEIKNEPYRRTERQFVTIQLTKAIDAETYEVRANCLQY